MLGFSSDLCQRLFILFVLTVTLGLQEPDSDFGLTLLTFPLLALSLNILKLWIKYNFGIEMITRANPS